MTPPSDDMKWLNKLKVFWLRIPQVDDLARLKVVGTCLANFDEKNTKHEMGLKKLNTLANDKNTLVWLGKFGAS